MWKILIAFVIFAALALYVLMKGGGNIDLGGEKHGAETQQAEPAKAEAAKAEPAKSEPAKAEAEKK